MSEAGLRLVKDLFLIFYHHGPNTRSRVNCLKTVGFPLMIRLYLVGLLNLVLGSSFRHWVIYEIVYNFFILQLDVQRLLEERCCFVQIIFQLFAKQFDLLVSSFYLLQFIELREDCNAIRLSQFLEREHTLLEFSGLALLSRDAAKKLGLTHA